jgi:hypothetical protein
VNPAIKKEKWTAEEDAQVRIPVFTSTVRARHPAQNAARVDFLATEAASAPQATPRATAERPRHEGPPIIPFPSFSPEPSKLRNNGRLRGS